MRSKRLDTGKAGGIVKLILEAGLDQCVVSEIAIAELYVGLYKGKDERQKREVEAVQRLFTVLPITPAIELYAKNRAGLELSSNKIDDFDYIRYRSYPLKHTQSSIQSDFAITFTKSPVFYITSCVTNSPEATDSEIKWKDAKAANIEGLNFETTGGEFIYDHKVYSTCSTDELKEKGLMK